MRGFVRELILCLAATAIIASLQCASAPKAPFTSELPIGDWVGDWTGDGNPQVLVVTNPLSFPVHVDIACSKPDGGDDLWATDVNAHDEVRVLIQTFNKDEFANICRTTGWHRLDHARHKLVRTR